MVFPYGFDMSEYSQEQSDQRLMGAPPGYVGYDEGGQLTNAVRDNPFSVLLFDEIEKASPKIFDKFLAMLDDGRMTDGKGQTIYFSETVIIFTSNLGIYKEVRKNGFLEKVLNVEPGEDYEQVKNKMMTEIKKFFNETLGRPELLNRFGENFVVFDFIRPEIAEEIIEKNIEKIREKLQEKKKR